MTTTTMDGLQVYKNEGEYIVTIAATMTNKPELYKLDNLKNAGDKFFDVKSISGKGRYKIVYDVPPEAQSLLSLKGCHEIIKLSLLNEVLKDDLLNQKDSFIPVIHPENIFCIHIRNIKYLYADNGELYRSSVPALEQYKALVISMLTKFSFEKMQSADERKTQLQKKGDLFLIQIEKAKTVSDMRHIVEQRLNKLETEYFIKKYQEDKKTEKKTTTKFTVTMVCAIIILILMVCILVGR